MNNLFQRTVKYFFCNKGSHQGNIKLVAGNSLLQDDSKVEEDLNKFFEEVVSTSTLDVNENCYIINLNSVNISDRIEKL